MLGTIFGTSPSISTAPNILESSLNTGQQSLANVLTNLLAGGGSSVVKSLFPSYTGQVAAPVSSATTGATDALTSLIPGATTAMGQASGVQAQGQSTLQDLLSRTPSSYQGYYNQNVFGPLLSAFGSSGISDIIGATGGTGTTAGGAAAGGGTGQGAALGSALQQLGTTLGSTQGQLTYKTGQQNVSNILSALQTLQGVTGAPIDALSTILSGGVSGQQAQQNYLDALYKDYTTGNKTTGQFLSDLLGYLGVSTLTPATTAVTTGGSSGLLGSLLGGIGGSAAGTALGNLFSSSGGGAAAATDIAAFA